MLRTPAHPRRDPLRLPRFTFTLLMVVIAFIGVGNLLQSRGGIVDRGMPLKAPPVDPRADGGIVPLDFRYYAINEFPDTTEDAAVNQLLNSLSARPKTPHE